VALLRILQFQASVSASSFIGFLYDTRVTAANDEKLGDGEAVRVERRV
jgi:hypothetical protein